MKTPDQVSVLFVCLGNICRSPLAEGVFINLLAEEGREDGFSVDSAGTGGWHVDERPDPRSIEIAEKNGVELPSRARQVTPADLSAFDVIVAMDRSNLMDLQALKDKHGGDARLVLMRDFDPDPGDGQVPDPYYGGKDGFARVFEMLDRSARGLLEDMDQ